ncbi:MAG: hypothetical protein K8I00_10870 [Candidatus Omnitrophica bacterium]|nr:hypothetical protein [Candidatus Omnitrophota bacterium]
MKKQHINFSIVIVISVCLYSGISFASADRHGHDSVHVDSHESVVKVEHGLMLNDGKKWKMDHHTKSIFSKMAKEILDRDMSLKSSEELKLIATGLALDIQSLISDCTMTGAAHDQLHKFLAGYMPAVYDLKEYGRKESAAIIKEYLQAYSNYFE